MMSKQTTTNNNEKPAYVLALEKAYGPPSQEGFGGAVFFEELKEDTDLEEVAKKYYQYFVGELWERWGEDAWMSPWKEVYARKADAKHDIAKELRGIEDFDASQSVPLVLDIIEDDYIQTATIRKFVDRLVTLGCFQHRNIVLCCISRKHLDMALSR